MLPSEKIAIAAHLHVLLRRKTGRVTDTEWMASNAEKDGHTDLGEWAAKLEATLAPTPPAATIAEKFVGMATAALPNDANQLRYIRGIR